MLVGEGSVGTRKGRVGEVTSVAAAADLPTGTLIA